MINEHIAERENLEVQVGAHAAADHHHARFRHSSTWRRIGINERSLPLPTVVVRLAPSHGASDRTANPTSPDTQFGLSSDSRFRAPW